MIRERIAEFLRYKVAQVFHKTMETVKRYPVQAVIVAGAALLASPGTAVGLATGLTIAEAGLQTATAQSLFTKEGWADLAQDVKSAVTSPDRFKLTTNKVLVGGAVGAGYLMGGVAALPILGAVYLGVREIGSRIGSGRAGEQLDNGPSKTDDPDIPNFRF